MPAAAKAAAAPRSFAGRIKAALTRKLGPLPAWAWLSIAAGGIFLYMRRSGAGAASEAPGVLPSSAADAGAAYPTGDSGSGGGGGGLPGVDYPPNTTLPSDVPPLEYPADNLPPYYPSDYPADEPPTNQGQPFDRATTLQDPGDFEPLPGRRETPRSGQLARQVAVSLPSGRTVSSSIPGNAQQVRVLPSGAIVYQTPSGALIEQAPGRTRYRIGSGNGPAGIPIPSSATDVRVTRGGGVIYRTPSGNVVQQAPGRPRYVVQRAHLPARTTQGHAPAPSRPMTRTFTPPPAPSFNPSHPVPVYPHATPPARPSGVLGRPPGVPMGVWRAR